QYDWFILEQDQIIGVKKEAISEKERMLLHTFLTAYEQHFPVKTVEEQKWEQLIRGEGKQKQAIQEMYRFVFFSFERQQLKPIQFKTAISAIFDEDKIGRASCREEGRIGWEEKKERRMA